MVAQSRLERGRAAFDESAWSAAFAHLEAADKESELVPADLELLATAAYLTGRPAESQHAYIRAYHGWLAQRRVDLAAGCAYWLAFGLITRGELAASAGWAARGLRELDSAESDCVQRGYLTTIIAVQQFFQGHVEEAIAGIAVAAPLAERYADADLYTLTALLEAQVQVQLGQLSEGIAQLDELMVSVLAGEVSPVIAGLTYCAVIGVCNDVFDLDRAREWSGALSRFCDRQPDLVPYSAACQVHRAEIMCLRGDWTDAVTTANLACERSVLSTDQVSAGEARYLLGDLYRLRGDLAAAEDAYWQASELGREPQPGLALLRIAQGQNETAQHTIRRLYEEAQDRPVLRANVLIAFIEIAVAAGDLDDASRASLEVAELAKQFDAPYLHAAANHRGGEVLLARGEIRQALARLRRAHECWRKLGATYEAARVRELIGRACAALGDHDAARLEFASALATFESLGAAPDAARLAPAPVAGLLTARELDVLREVAAGHTNREVAAALFLSEKTVARHLSNIFTKLGLRSRAAATSYAYEHGLL